MLGLGLLMLGLNVWLGLGLLILGLNVRVRVVSFRVNR